MDDEMIEHYFDGNGFCGGYDGNYGHYNCFTKPMQKMSYKECRDWLNNHHNGGIFFSDNLLGEAEYTVSMWEFPKNKEMIVIRINGIDAIYLSKNEFGIAFVGNSNIMININVGNLFIYDGYRLSYDDGLAVLKLIDKDGDTGRAIKKLLVISKELNTIYSE